MSTSREELTTIQLTVLDSDGNKAQLPDDLQGHVFFMSFAGTVAAPKPDKQPSGAIPQETIMPAGSSYHTALFNGDGMVYRLDFSPPEQPSTKDTGDGSEDTLENNSENNAEDTLKDNAVRLTSRLLKPPAFFADQITYENAQDQGSADYPALKGLQFWDLGFARLSDLGNSNQPNTALVALQTGPNQPVRLMATNDATPPYEIDPCSLKIIAPIGSVSPTAKVWQTYQGFAGVFPLVLSTAHPCTDCSQTADSSYGELFTINVIKSLKDLALHNYRENNPDGADKLFLIRWRLDATGGENLHRWEVKHHGQSIQILQSTHMLGITENYVIIADTAMKFEQIESVVVLLINMLCLWLDCTLSPERRADDIRKIREQLNVGLAFAKLEVAEFLRQLQPSLENIKQRLTSPFSKLSICLSWASILVGIALKQELLAGIQALEEDLAAIATSQSDPVNFRDLQAFNRHLDNFQNVNARQPGVANRSRPRVSGVLSQLTMAVNKALSYFADEIAKSIKLKFSAMQNSNTYLYVVKRRDLENVSLDTSLDETAAEPSVEAVKIYVPAPLAHFLTDYEETNGKITAVAPMAYALDASEYLTRFDRPQWSSVNIKPLAGMIPLGLDSNCPALLVIDPTLDGEAILHELNQPVEKDPLYIGLYAYRDDMPTRQLTDVYWLCGGAWPEMITEFIYDLYQGYHPRRISLADLERKVRQGIPMEISHMGIDRERLRDQPPSNPPVPGSKYLFEKETYVFEPGLMVFAIHFVPRVESTQGDDGYLVCTVVRSDNLYAHSDESQPDDWSGTAQQTKPDNWSDNSEIWIFDARCIHTGPQYKLSCNRLNFGMTLHSIWLKTIASVPQRAYSFEQDYGDWINRFKENFGTGSHADDIDGQLDYLFREIDKRFSQYQNASD